jgi:ElaB/YqjD/DUF883 family membrane-anchored ribosome-binding protein
MAMKIEFPDKAAQAKIKKQIAEKLAVGRKKIQELEKYVRSGEAGEKITAELKKAKAQLEVLKEKYKESEEKALEYVHENPKKALLIAAAVGVVAGAVLSALRSEKPKPKKKK